MAGLSIRLDRFSVGPHHIDPQEMFPTHKKNVEGYLSKIFQRHVKEPSEEKVSVSFHLNARKPSLSIQDREIPLQPTRGLKKVSRIVRYYQDTGYLPKQKMGAKEAEESRMAAQKSIKALRHAAIPGANGSVLAGMRLADDTLSLTRNILFSIPEIGPQDPIVNHLGYYAGVFWSFFAFRELDDGISEYKRSKAVGDGEGRRRAEARILSGGTVLAGSAAYLAGKFCDTYSSAVLASTLSNASNMLFGVGSLVGIGVSLLGAVRCERFNSRLNAYLENSKLADVQKFKGALQFLKDSLTVTLEERTAIKEEIEEKYPNLNPALKEDLFQQRLTDRAEAKVKYMKRRTSNKSLHLIVSQVDKILAKLDDPKARPEGIKEAALLISTIQQENKLKMTLYSLSLIASILSFLGMILATFTTGGVLPFVLYGIAGTIYLALTIYSIGGMFLLPNPEEEPQLALSLK
jgi:hypothetical protein